MCRNIIKLKFLKFFLINTWIINQKRGNKEDNNTSEVIEYSFELNCPFNMANNFGVQL